MIRNNHTKYSRFILISAVIFLLLTLSIFPEFEQGVAQTSDTLDVTFIDVGQGDSALLSTSNGVNILIDAGPQSAGQTVLAYLNDQSVSVLEVVVISHNHADHIGGLIDVLQSTIHVGTILYNGNSCTTITCQNVWTEMGLRGITPTAVKVGDSFQWGSISTEILNPQTSLTNNENEDSVVMDVSFSDFRLLYTGDIGFSTESLLISQGTLYSTDVLKVAHHGSAYSTSTNFLNTINPLNAVISVGNNSYGHPSDETLQRLGSSEATIFRTDLNGNIIFTFYDSDPPESTPTATHAPTPTSTTFNEEMITIYLPILMGGGGVTPPPQPTPTATQDPTPTPTLTSTPTATQDPTPTPTLTSTPTATQDPTPTPTLTSTPTATQDPTPTPTLTQEPNPMPGENRQCNIYGNAEICASVSNANPPRYSYVTVYGRLIIDGTPQEGKTMLTTWNYKTSSPDCNTGVTNSEGLANCERYISGASAGFQVNIDVSIEGYEVVTWFTPE